jgi:septal ring factor EnvC (AmiA/AmiB activator)
VRRGDAPAGIGLVVSIFRRRPPARPTRQPHPDPRMESRLQRIIALRETAARKEDLSRQYAQEIGKLSTEYRTQAKLGQGFRARDMESRLKDLQADIRQLEEEIGRVHDEIAERTAELDDTDLAYL